jgi:hypothetical protein
MANLDKPIREGPERPDRTLSSSPNPIKITQKPGSAIPQMGDGPEISQLDKTIIPVDTSGLQQTTWKQ